MAKRSVTRVRPKAAKPRARGARRNPPAVAAKPATPNPRARKRRLIARRGAARHVQRAAEKIYEMNPAGLAGFAQMVLPAFAGYAATRFISRIAYVQLSARTKHANHLSVLASAATTFASHLASQHVDALEQYGPPATFGSAIATLQAVIQTYLPKFGWIVSDYLPPPGMRVLRDHRRRRRAAAEEIDDGAGEDEFESEFAAAAPAGAGAAASTADDFEDGDDLGTLGSMDEDGDNMSGGSLGVN